MVHKVVYRSGVLSRMQPALLQFSTEVTNFYTLLGFCLFRAGNGYFFWWWTFRKL